MSVWLVYNQGWIQDFYVEGAQKIMYAHAHHEREARSLSGFLMLSEPYFYALWYKMGLK